MGNTEQHMASYKVDAFLVDSLASPPEFTEVIVQ
jgi:hypothetical protein